VPNSSTAPALYLTVSFMHIPPIFCILNSPNSSHKTCSLFDVVAVVETGQCRQDTFVVTDNWLATGITINVEQRNSYVAVSTVQLSVLEQHLDHTCGFSAKYIILIYIYIYIYKYNFTPPSAYIGGDNIHPGRAVCLWSNFRIHWPPVSPLYPLQTTHLPAPTNSTPRQPNTV